MNLGVPELLILMVIVLLLFGPGRIGNIAGEIGSGIRSFREGLKGDDKEPEKTENKDMPKESEKAGEPEKNMEPVKSAEPQMKDPEQSKK